MRQHWMMDIETLSVHPTNAVVLSIALVGFEMKPMQPTFGKELVVFPNLREQFALGRQADPKTQAWWRQQSDAARDSWNHQDRETPIAHCLTEIGDALAGACPAVDAVAVWAHGPFDCSNVADLYDACDLIVPWRYNDVRDERTIIMSTPPLRALPAGAQIARDHQVLHDALHDCRRQIWNLWTHWVFAEGVNPGEEQYPPIQTQV